MNNKQTKPTEAQQQLINNLKKQLKNKKSQVAARDYQYAIKTVVNDIVGKSIPEYKY